MNKIADYTENNFEKSQRKMVDERMEKMKRKREGYEADWNDADKQRQMWRDERPKDDWRSDLKLPDTFSIIETAKAEMVDQSPGIVYRPRDPGDEEKALKHNKIYEYSWEKGNGDFQLLNFVDDGLVYGVAIGEEYWRQDVVDRKYIEDFDLENFKPLKWRKDEETIFDDVFFESIPIWNFYWDPMATNLDNARDCIKRLTMPYDEFKKRYKRFPNHKKVASGGNVYRAEWFKPIGNLDDHEIEVLHYWDQINDSFLIIANGVLLTPPGNPIPYKHKKLPFIHSVDILLAHSFVGMGEPKVIKSLQEERNTLRNMRLDTTHLNIQTQYLVDDRLELDDEDLIARPHGIIKGPLDSIKPVDKIPLFSESYKEEDLINDDIIKASGIDVRLQSVSGGNATATEAAILKESSLKRIRLKLRLIELLGLRRIGRLRLGNVQQFYSIPKIKKILGEDGKIRETETYRDVGFMTPKGELAWFTARPEDITGEYDVEIIQGKTLPVSKALESQKRINLFDRLIGHPEVDQRELARMLILAHDESDDKLLIKGGGVVNPLAALTGGGTEMPTAMPTVGVNRSAAKAKIRPEEVLPGRAMAGGVGV